MTTGVGKNFEEMMLVRKAGFQLLPLPPLENALLVIDPVVNQIITSSGI
jgi:hypothetical protein